MKIELDSEAKAIYVRLDSGRVADTFELADAVVLDKAGDGRPLGIEFVHAEDFEPFLREHPNLVSIPSRLRYESLDKSKTWQVETGMDGDGTDGTGAVDNLALNARFIGEVIADSSTLDAIPEGSVVVLTPGGEGAASEARPDLTDRLSRQGHDVVVRLLGVPISASRQALS